MTDHATFDKKTIERESCAYVCVCAIVCQAACANACANVFVKVQECDCVCTEVPGEDLSKTVVFVQGLDKAHFGLKGQSFIFSLPTHITALS